MKMLHQGFGLDIKTDKPKEQVEYLLSTVLKLLFNGEGEIVYLQHEYENEPTPQTNEK